jgi:hypothetical protein
MDYINDFTEIKEEVGNLYKYEEDRASKEVKEVPNGTYIVEISSMMVGLTKANKPALKAKFTVTDGEYTHGTLYMTTVLTSSYTTEKACNFLKALGTDVNVYFDNTENFKKITEEIFNKIKGNCEFDLTYWTNAKGFNEFKIEGVYDLV